MDVSLTHPCFSPSFSPFLPHSLKINKFFKKEAVMRQVPQTRAPMTARQDGWRIYIKLLKLPPT